MISHSAYQLPIATALGVALSFLLMPLARRLGWMDIPDSRKVHESATPLCGGLAVYLSIVFMVLFWTGPDVLEEPLVFWAIIGAGAMCILGFIDDMRNLSSTLRFLFQAVFCLLVSVKADVRLEDFGNLFFDSPAQLGILAGPVTIFAAMGVINAFNLSDGLDGLAGTLFCTSSLFLVWFAFQSGNFLLAWFLLICLSALLGFLLLNARFPWNNQAFLFLGDAGSLMLGFILAWGFIFLGSGPERAFTPMTAVWLFAVPLLDTSTLIWQRWRAGRSVFSADQSHLHHAFLRAGFSVEQTWGMISLFGLVMAAIGFGFEVMNVPDYLSFYSFMCCAFFYYFYMKYSWASQRFLGRNFIHHDFTVDERMV